MGERNADPDDAEQSDADRDGDTAATAALGTEGEEQQEASGQDQQDVEGGAEMGSDDQRDNRGIGGFLQRVETLCHREVLAQAEHPDPDHRPGEDEATGDGDRDREDRPRDRDQHPFGGLTGSPAATASFGTRRRFAHRLLREHLVVEQIPHQSRAPKRRCRASNSLRDSSSASRLKSGQSSSRKISSE